jgi:ATP-binding cassette subfamily C (CFTR/MRP) protein 1
VCVCARARAKPPQVLGDTSQLMGPLVIRAIIDYGKAHNSDGTHHGSLGAGVAMAIGLFLLTVTASVCQHQVRGAACAWDKR